MKTCTKCGAEKYLNEFPRATIGKVSPDGHYSQCKKCKTAAHKAWRTKNRDKTRAAMKRWRDGRGKQYKIENKDKLKAQIRAAQLKRLYGTTPEVYERLFREQNGACGICRKQNTNGQRLCIDHDHKTGEIRGLLCRPCNVGIGYLKDSAEILTNAAHYIESRNLSKKPQEAA